MSEPSRLARGQEGGMGALMAKKKVMTPSQAAKEAVKGTDMGKPGKKKGCG